MEPPANPARFIWADFVAPTATCEGGNFLTLNTYDRARFTWGFGQFAAHVPDGDFVHFFRAMLARPEHEDYFPDLEVVSGRISKVRSSGPVALESATSTGLLMDLLNPSALHVEDTEVIAAAKIIHWTTAHPGAQSLQVDHMIATFRRLMKEADRRLGLDGKTADLCAIVCDIRHQGRGKFATMLEALRRPDPFHALLEIGQPKFAGRCRTLEKALTTARALFQSKTWSRSQQDFV